MKSAEQDRGKAEYPNECVCIGGKIEDGDTCWKCGRTLPASERRKKGVR